MKNRKKETAILEGHHLYFRQNSRIILEDVSFVLNAGELLFVKGESGSGKTTFLKVINRLLIPDSGTILYRGNDYKNIHAGELRKCIQMVPQISVFLTDRIKDDLLLTGFYDENLVRKYLKEFRLTESLLDQNPGTLSTGQAQRISILRALLFSPEILLLDEPTSALDPGNRDNFVNFMLLFLRRRKISCIWITHDTGKFPGTYRTLRIKSHA